MHVIRMDFRTATRFPEGGAVEFAFRGAGHTDRQLETNGLRYIFARV